MEDPRSTPFPGKSQPTKPKINRKIAYSVRTNAKEPLNSRKNRVFGTARNPNIPSKISVKDKPLIKPSISLPKKETGSVQSTNVAPKESLEDNRSPENPKPKLKKKSVGFDENPKTIPKDCSSQRENSVDLKTPAKSPFVKNNSNDKAKVTLTPFHTARSCSKCRYDKLETASYWAGQIKLAESVEKHFVSAAFFRLAFESNAEPIRNLKIELKRYLGRHGYLSEQTEWRDISVSYGIGLKVENKAEEVNSEMIRDGDEEQKGLVEEENSVALTK